MSFWGGLTPEPGKAFTTEYTEAPLEAPPQSYTEETLVFGVKELSLRGVTRQRDDAAISEEKH